MYDRRLNEEWSVSVPALDDQASRDGAGGNSPEPDNCGDLGIRIGRSGEWFYHGSPIHRKEMVCLFASLLTRLDDGSYWLITPDEIGRIEVDDVPFLAVEMFCDGAGRDLTICFRTNVDEIITLDCCHPLRLDQDP